MKTVLKICGNDWSHASRNKREMSAFKECGYEVLVLTKGAEDDRGREDCIDGLKVLRYTTSPLGASMPKKLNRIATVFAWAHYAGKLKPDVISGHDLIPGLTIAWLSTLFQRKRPKLVYDAHEFELGRNKKRSKAKLAVIRVWEKYLIRRSAFSMMVSDTIADEVVKIHGLKERPVVVRNMPSHWTVDAAACLAERERLLAQFENKDVSHLMMFHGNMGRGNGIESVIKVLKDVPGLGLVLLGQTLDKKYFESLLSLAKEENVADRIVCHDAVPIEELGRYIGAMDVEMMVIEPIVKSYYYVLPNKMFEAIQAEVPVIASDLPEMRGIIDRYGIGLTCRPGDVAGVRECLERLLTDAEFYAQCKANVRQAKEVLCWEKEKEVLKAAIEEKL